MGGLILVAMVMLTRPDGYPVYVSGREVTAVSRPGALESTQANSRIDLTSGKSIWVMETPDQVKSRIETADAVNHMEDSLHGND